MERTYNINNHKYKVTNENISIDEMKLTPGEVSTIVELLGIAGSMSGLRALPPEISSGSFTIEFSEDGNHLLIRDFDPNTIQFTFEDIDNIINDIQMCLDSALDLQKISPKVVPHVHGHDSGDIIEGR